MTETKKKPEKKLKTRKEGAPLKLLSHHGTLNDFRAEKKSFPLILKGRR